jgi:hypothetical protein
MNILYIIGMAGFIMLALVLVIGVWQDYREELKKHSNVLRSLHKVVVLKGESSVERNYEENKAGKELFPTSWPVYVPSMRELTEKKR